MFACMRVCACLSVCMSVCVRVCACVYVRACVCVYFRIVIVVDTHDKITNLPSHADEDNTIKLTVVEFLPSMVKMVAIMCA